MDFKYGKKYEGFQNLLKQDISVRGGGSFEIKQE
jgi:hypothetical protein